MNSIPWLFGSTLILVLWLLYKYRARRNNPYELIDLQKEIREQREKENESR